MKELVSAEYKNWIESLKQKFQSSQIKASIQVNRTLLEFYWDLPFTPVSESPLLRCKKQKDITRHSSQ